MKEDTRIILLEDEYETFLKELYPNLDIVTWITFNNQENISKEMRKLIKQALRNNPEWLIISEVRGEEAKELYDKLESLLHEKHYEATYKSPLVGLFVSSCSFQSNKGIITLIIIERDYDYQVKMSYTDRINYIPVYRKQHQKELDDM